MKTITKHYIDGEFVESHGLEVMDIVNPANGKVIAHVTLSARIADLTKMMVEEYGGVVQFAGPIVQAGADVFLAAEKALHELPLTRSWGKTTVTMEPVGVAGLISPWNANAFFLCMKLASAVAAGCTVVMKPSELSAPQTSAWLECVHEAKLPKGLCNVVSGRGDVVGAELVRNPDVAKISFTGSAAVGRSIMRDGAATMKRVTLELGGKSPNILLDDANLSNAVPNALIIGFLNNGQACVAGTRLLVPKSRFDEVKKLIVDTVPAPLQGRGRECTGLPALRVYIFRPAYIYPWSRARDRTSGYRLLRAIYPVFRVLFRNQVIPADPLARAMVDVVLQETGKRAKVVLENRDIRMRAERRLAYSIGAVGKGHFFNPMATFSVQYGIAWGEVADSMGLDSEIVYIIDDDPIVRDALSSLLRSNGKTVRLFTSGTEFLSFNRDDTAACLVLDLKMPGMGGLEVQKVVSAQTSIPIVSITGRGDIPSTVKAMKGGAVEFLTKPVDEAVLLAAVEQALQKDRSARLDASERADLLACYRSLTPREQGVLPLLVSGLLNKQAAAELGISEYTVQIHRGNIMRKMKADSFAMLVKLAKKLSPEKSGALGGKN